MVLSHVRGVIGSDGKLFAIGIVLGLIILVIDIALPLGVAAGVPYVGVVLLGMWARTPNYAYVMATATTILTVTGYLISPEGGVYWMVLTNRAVALVAIWTTALLVTGARRFMEDNLSLREEAVASQLAAEDERRAAMLLQQVANAANEARGSAGAVEACLKAICRYMDLPMGHLYLADQDTGELYSSDLWHLTDHQRFEGFVRITKAMKFTPGLGLPGRAIAAGKLEWMTDITDEREFLRADAAEKCGIRSAFAFPILIGTEVVAIMEFFSERNTGPDDQILKIVDSVGIQLGRTLERQRNKAGAEQQQQELADLNQVLADERDRADKANRAKSEFLAAMSHELRTPLNAVIGFSEVINEEVFGPVGNEKYQGYICDIHSAGTHLLGLINDILDLAKIEAGKEEVYDEVIDIAEFLPSIRSLVGHRAEETAVQLVFEMPEEPSSLVADARKLKQILVNLLGNALKFTDPGGKVTLKAWSSSDGFIFQVIDTGVGMSPEEIRKAMMRFGQVNGGLNRLAQGTGLGLPLSKMLVELHGGSLDLQSTPGEGTTITVRFPASRIPDAANRSARVAGTARS